MPIFYVSDLLSDLIGADAVRAAVRRQCESVLIDVPPPTAERLRAPLHYIAGKCMGYPAVWLIGTALELGEGALAARLQRHPGPLYISLTTSIADDFIDRDENIGAAHMMLLYLFVFSSLRHPHWFNGELLETYQRLIYPLIGAFVGDHPLSDSGNRVELELRAERSSWRIGNFFETIVRGLTCEDAPATRSALAELGRAFGNWCSHLDDVVDVERDIVSGDTFTYPLFLIAQHSPRLAEAVRGGDLESCFEAIEAGWFVEALVERHQGYLEQLEAIARQAGFERLAGEFARLALRLPGLIRAIRRENSQAGLRASVEAAPAEARCA